MNFFTKSIRAFLKKGTELKGTPYTEAKSYDELYLCTPIWALNGTPAMISFINNVDFTDKSIKILTVRGFPDSVSGTHKYLSNKIKSRNGNVIATYDIKGAPIGKTTTLSNIQDQIKKLKI